MLPPTQSQTLHDARGDSDTTLADLEARIARAEENLRVDKKRKLDWERREKRETLKKRHGEVAAEMARFESEMARLESELRGLDSDEGGKNQTM